MPFSLAPDTNQFVSLDDHQACFDLLVYALSTGEGFVKIVGDVGTGKTILCRKLLRYLNKEDQDLSCNTDYVTVYIPNPMLSPIGLLRALAHELGVPLVDETASDVVLEQVSFKMLELAKEHKSVVVIVDEAQALPEDTLEALRLVTNLETETHKLVQVVLFGQTELDEILHQYKFRQLNQRITFSHYLQALSLSNTEHYINFRTINVGFRGEPLFKSSAIKRMYSYSKGIPRKINVLAHKALLSAYSQGRQRVTDKDVQRAWKDSQKNEHHSSQIIWIIVFGFLASSALALTWVQIKGGFLL